MRVNYFSYFYTFIITLFCMIQEKKGSHQHLPFLFSLHFCIFLPYYFTSLTLSYISISWQCRFSQWQKVQYPIKVYLAISLEAHLLFSRDAYCNLFLLHGIPALIIQILYINIQVSISIHVSIDHEFCIKVALYQRENILVLSGMACFIEYNHLQLGPFGSKQKKFVLFKG